MDATSLVITDVRSILFETIRGVLSITQNSGKIREFDFSGAATVTYTVCAGNSTVVVI